MSKWFEIFFFSLQRAIFRTLGTPFAEDEVRTFVHRSLRTGRCLPVDLDNFVSMLDNARPESRVQDWTIERRAEDDHLTFICRAPSRWGSMKPTFSKCLGSKRGTFDSAFEPRL